MRPTRTSAAVALAALVAATAVGVGGTGAQARPAAAVPVPAGVGVARTAPVLAAAPIAAPAPDGRRTGEVPVLGTLDTATWAPAGLGLAAGPGPSAAGRGTSPASAAAGSLAAAPSCSHQCIASGIARPRGFGAELVVETTVPAALFLAVVADADGDGQWDLVEHRTSAGRVTHQSWAFDDLEPGQTYHATLAATDEHGHTSHAWGPFTTLASRSAHLMVTDVEIIGGPTNVVLTQHRLRVGDGHPELHFPGWWADLDATERYVDVGLLVSREWEASSPCEPFWPVLMEQPQGDSDDSCLSWNTATAEVDLEAMEGGGSSWASTSYQVTLRTPPGDTTDPRHFHVVAEATVVVAYD